MIALNTSSVRPAARGLGQDAGHRARFEFDLQHISPGNASDPDDVDAQAEATRAKKLKARLFIECPNCAYEPPQQDAAPRGGCPKCGAHTWRRVWQSGRSLASMG